MELQLGMATGPGLGQVKQKPVRGRTREVCLNMSAIIILGAIPNPHPKSSGFGCRVTRRFLLGVYF
jgi:hypothetical protein